MHCEVGDVLVQYRIEALRVQISRHGLLQGSLVCLQLCQWVLLLGMLDEVVADGVGSCIARLAMFWFSNYRIEALRMQISRHGLIV